MSILECYKKILIQKIDEILFDFGNEHTNVIRIVNLVKLLEVMNFDFEYEFLESILKRFKGILVYRCNDEMKDMLQYIRTRIQ